MYWHIFLFTSHYVSINSMYHFSKCYWQQIFTSHYVSINSSNALHTSAKQNIFTSHYVSINSDNKSRITTPLLYLHPTMYLLIPFFCLCLSFVMYYLHPTMYLLIRAKLKRIYVALEFTSHYVSINSIMLMIKPVRPRIFTSHYVSINSR